MTQKFPRLFLAAPKSGSGKTLITCGLLQLLKDSGYFVSSFKCGPDYIDPMFHKTVIGVPSKNLDTFFTGKELVKSLFADSAGGDKIAVIEGVMGYYDGLHLEDTASSYELSSFLCSPVILIVDCKGASLSILPLIEGFISFRSHNGTSRIKGVILNRVSAPLYESLKLKIEEYLHIPVLGRVPALKEPLFKSRHLGLILPEEISGLREKVQSIANVLSKTLDVPRIMNLAETAPPLTCRPLSSFLPDNADRIPPVKIAVAKDAAFCFYYEDNLSLFRRMNAVLIPFSPLNDMAVPKEADGIYLGGGYPELHAGALSCNLPMLHSIKENLQNGMPCLAECGGFMYLLNSMEASDGRCYPMADVLPGKSVRQDSLKNFGYHVITASGDNLLCKKGESLRVHEFHYWNATNPGTAFTARKPYGTETRQCIHSTKNITAGYPHFYFYHAPSMAVNFLESCGKYRVLNQSKNRCNNC